MGNGYQYLGLFGFGEGSIDSQMKYSNSQSVTGPTGEVMFEGTEGELVGLLD